MKVGEVYRTMPDERLKTADGAELSHPEQVCEALLAYYDAGVSTLLIHGFNPLQDAIEYEREPIPMVRAQVARRVQRRET
jgi:hypothetical protein